MNSPSEWKWTVLKKRTWGYNVSHQSTVPEALTLPFPHHLEIFIVYSICKHNLYRHLDCCFTYLKGLRLSSINRKQRFDSRLPFQYTQKFNTEVGKKNPVSSVGTIGSEVSPLSAELKMSLQISVSVKSHLFLLLLGFF